jgi:hypothetical protein
MRWRLLLEEYGPKLIYLPGDITIVADELSPLSFNPIVTTDQHSQDAKGFGATKDVLPIDIHPLKHSNLLRDQQQLKHIHRMFKKVPHYNLKTFRGAYLNDPSFATRQKTVAPSDFQKPMVQWYHDTLCHPGITRTKKNKTTILVESPQR